MRWLGSDEFRRRRRQWSASGTLDVAVSAGPMTAAAPLPVERSEVPVGHVTVVADDADQSDQLETALSTQGHRVTGLDRPGVPECSRLAGTTDLVVVIGPPQFGCAVSAALRRGGVDACILVVGSGAKNDRIAGLQAGADDYLTTPYHLDELFARVRALLRHRRYRAVR